jgi:hypothetical protein
MRILSRIAHFQLKRTLPALKASRPGPDLPIQPKVIYLEVSYQCNLKCTMCTRHFEGVPQEIMAHE